MATKDTNSRSMDRVSMIRRALEEKRSPATIYSPRAVISKPWAAARAAGALEKAFPDYEVQVLDAFEASDKVTVRWRMTATHSGEFKGIKASNAKVDITGINVYRFVGDRVVESYGEMDGAALAQQCEQQAQLGDEVMKALSQRVV
jgi:hypothetical protein